MKISFTVIELIISIVIIIMLSFILISFSYKIQYTSKITSNKLKNELDLNNIIFFIKAHLTEDENFELKNKTLYYRNSKLSKNIESFKIKKENEFIYLKVCSTLQCEEESLKKDTFSE